MGYFGHFPQHVTFCCHLPDNLPVLESVAAESKAAGGGLPQLDGRLVPPGHVLTPGVCLPCYCQQRDVVLDPGQERRLTMQNHVFRYEANSFRPLARAWDFTVRDIVLFGSHEDLVGLRAEVKCELLFNLPQRDEPLAVSSFNLHRDYYTSIHNTRRADGGLAESACIGFGLERWLYGFLSQKGMDPAKWPERVTSRMESGGFSARF